MNHDTAMTEEQRQHLEQLKEEPYFYLPSRGLAMLTYLTQLEILEKLGEGQRPFVLPSSESPPADSDD
jgi:hypothetical protein